MAHLKVQNADVLWACRFEHFFITKNLLNAGILLVKD